MAACRTAARTSSLDHEAQLHDTRGATGSVAPRARFQHRSCLWQVSPRFVPDGRPNGTLRLALRIARNLALDETRRLRAVQCDPETLERALHQAAEVVEPVEPDPHLRRAIDDCRGQLPRQPARALTARIDSEGTKTDRALAQETGMQLNTFLQNVTRARRLMAACLEERGVRVAEELA